MAVVRDVGLPGRSFTALRSVRWSGVSRFVFPVRAFPPPAARIAGWLQRRLLVLYFSGASERCSCHRSDEYGVFSRSAGAAFGYSRTSFTRISSTSHPGLLLACRLRPLGADMRIYDSFRRPSMCSRVFMLVAACSLFSCVCRPLGKPRPEGRPTIDRKPMRMRTQWPP